ncbi:serine protease [Candidatus Nomurabacteria bacterium]|nr:serine protease [Candidatus Nomurabacteria bacterium]
MDIKDLNKTQLILLAVLLSFVVSIATGITTVTLMQQAPTSFTVPVNRVIKQTIEKIQQVEGKTTIQTVIVKEEDLVVDAIAKNQSAIFTITRESLDTDGKTIEVGAGRGFVISTDGVVVVDANLVPDKGVYYVKNDSGKFKANFIFNDKAGFSFLKIGAPLNDKDKLIFTMPTFGDLSKMKIGQKVLVFGSGVSSFMFDGNKDIKINVTKSNGGGIVLDLDGNVLGIALFGESTSFAPIDSIINTLKLSLNPSTDPTTTMPAASILAPAFTPSSSTTP